MELGPWIPDPGSWIKVLGSRILDLGSWIQDPRSRIHQKQNILLHQNRISKSPAPQISKTHIFLHPKFIPPRKWSLDPGSQIQAPGSRFLDHGSRILDLGSWIQDPRSRIHQKQKILVQKIRTSKSPAPQISKTPTFLHPKFHPGDGQVVGEILLEVCVVVES